MQVKALRTFQSTTLGNVDADKVFEAPDALARQMIAAGYLQEYETKVVVQRPTKPAAPLSASPAGQASQQTIANESNAGAKRGKQPKTGASSQ